MTSSRLRRSILAIAATGALTFGLAACGGQDDPETTSNGDGGSETESEAPGGDAGGAVSGAVTADGSSTVGPLTEAAADLFGDENPDVDVTVATSGTGGGFDAFCAGETDISNASRPIDEEETAACESAGIDFTEIIMANDGLAVAVNPENDWATCLTVEQLQTIWSPESEGQITNWNQVDPSFPDQPLTLFGAGTDSGTFDYFTEAINGETGAIRTDYSPSEDDNVLVQGIAGDVGATGFFGLSYVEENPDSVKAVEVDGGNGCVAPSSETVQANEYIPLGRPLFIYVKNESYTGQPQVKAFVDFYVENAVDIAERALFIGLTPEQQQTATDELASLG